MMSSPFALLREARRGVRREWYAKNMAALAKAGLHYITVRDGWHVVVALAQGVDFWPSTGKWRSRSDGKCGRGVRSLLNAFGREEARAK